MKISIIYHSITGNTKAMAQEIMAGMSEVDGVEAKSFSIDAVDDEFVKESKCVIFGTPIYMASLTAEMQTFLQKKAGSLNLGGKLGGAFSTANFAHGGGDLGIRGILDCLMFYGMIVYSGGGACGAPPIHLGPIAIKENFDAHKNYFKVYGTRMAQKSVEIFNK